MTNNERKPGISLADRQPVPGEESAGKPHEEPAPRGGLPRLLLQSPVSSLKLDPLCCTVMTLASQRGLKDGGGSRCSRGHAPLLVPER